MFWLINIPFLILADTDSQCNINATSKSANNKHHYAIKKFEHIILDYFMYVRSYVSPLRKYFYH